MLAALWARTVRGQTHEPATTAGKATVGARNGGSTSTTEAESARLFVSLLARHASGADAAILALSTVSAVASGCVPPLMALIFGSLSGSLQQYVAHESSEASLRRDIVQVVLYVVYLAVGEFAATYCSTAGFLVVGERITTRIRVRYVDAALHQDIGVFDQVGTGEINTRITASMNTIQDGISQNVALLVVTASTSTAGLVIAFVRSWLLTVILLASFAFTAAVMAVGSRLAVRWNAAALQYAAEAASVADETFASIRTVVAYSIQPRQAEQYRQRLAASRRWGLWAKGAIGVMVACIMLGASLSYALAFWEGARLMASRNLSVAQVTTVILAVMIAAISTGNIAPFLEALVRAMSAAGPVRGVIAGQRAPRSGENTPPLDGGGIDFVAVSHAYPMRPDVRVLNNVSLSVPSGSRVAVVGPSGSGKSTLIYLLKRFYEPSKGQIRIGGVDIASMDVASLRRQLALVSQEPTLFNATVAANIAFGLDAGSRARLDPQALHGKIVAAAKMANAHHFVNALPQGYQTVVGERGGLLSGGQRQRIAIARAVVSDPRILLLDEATSALDAESEEAVQRALDNASRGRTTLVIAHRLSTVKTADRIIVMAGGEVQETGTHAELWAQRGLYHHLVEAQSLATEGDDEKIMPGAENTVESTAKESTQGVVHSEKSVSPTPSSGTPLGVWSALRLFGCFDRDRMPLCVGILSSILAGACQPVQSYLFAVVIAALSRPASERAETMSEVSFWSWIYFMMAFAELAIFSLQGLSLAYCAENLLLASRERTFAAVLDKPISFFDSGSHTTGKLTALLGSEPDRLVACTGATLGTMVRLVASLVGSFLLSLLVGWKLALVCIAAVPMALVCGVLRVLMLARLQRQAQETYRDSASYACEAFSAIRTVASLTLEEQVLDTYQEQVQAQLRRGCRGTLQSSVLFALAKTGGLLCAALGFGYGGLLVARREYSLSQFYTIISAVVFAADSFGTIFSFAPDLAKSQQASRVLQEMVDAPRAGSMRPGRGDELLHDEWRGEAQFSNVSFAYPSRPDQSVLRGLELEVPPGKHTAIVGPSGGGKSTVTNLLQRFYSPSQGVIRIGDRHLERLEIDRYRHQVALVAQEPVLYQGTIASNLAMGVTRPDQACRRQMEDVCRATNLYDFVTSLPEGLDTRVGTRAVSLSGGQRQRIALGRALMREPKLLILDEATSALDSQSEAAVLEAIEQASHKRTTVSVAHRLSTVRRADRIYVLERGRVVEFGTHEELMGRGGRYRDLVQLQRHD